MCRQYVNMGCSVLRRLRTGDDSAHVEIHLIGPWDKSSLSPACCASYVRGDCWIYFWLLVHTQPLSEHVQHSH